FKGGIHFSKMSILRVRRARTSCPVEICREWRWVSRRASLGEGDPSGKQSHQDHLCRGTLSFFGSASKSPLCCSWRFGIFVFLGTSFCGVASLEGLGKGKGTRMRSRWVRWPGRFPQCRGTLRSREEKTG